MSDRVQKYGEKILQSTRNLISYRYHAITKAINKEFWELSSETMHSIYVGTTEEIPLLIQVILIFLLKFQVIFLIGLIVLVEIANQECYK